ncbi:unnamed protein product [Hermetia illucens]|uniref:Uncharacterized protein n=2 Tax=Hermetia illucens TaxID=343691 RepID=A0A7R8UDB8_HERIL|nr:unnamed protein product [Hermetia illucens]
MKDDDDDVVGCNTTKNSPLKAESIAPVLDDQLEKEDNEENLLLKSNSLTVVTINKLENMLECKIQIPDHSQPTVQQNESYSEIGLDIFQSSAACSKYDRCSRASASPPQFNGTFSIGSVGSLNCRICHCGEETER